MSEALQAQINLLSTQLGEVLLRLEEAEGQIHRPAKQVDESPTPDQILELIEKPCRYRSTAEFVTQFVRVVIERPSFGAPVVGWCDAWLLHPEVNFIFEVMWRHYEEARAADLEVGGGTNLLGFYWDRFIPVIKMVLDKSSGPFSVCDHGHQDPKMLLVPSEADQLIRGESELQYEFVEEFIAQFIAHRFEVLSIGTSRSIWCDEWFDHPEVTFAVNAMWRSYEEACFADFKTQGGSARSSWYVMYYRPIMSYLVGPNGPMNYCETEHHEPEQIGGHELAGMNL